MDVRPPRPAGARASSKPIPIRRGRSMGVGLKEEEDASGRGAASGARAGRVGRARAGAHRSYGYGRGRRHNHGSRAVHAVDDDMAMGMEGLGAARGTMLSQSLPPPAPIVHSLPNPGMMDHMPTLSLPPPSPDATSYLERLREHSNAGALSAPARSYMGMADPRRRARKMSSSPTSMPLAALPIAEDGRQGGAGSRNSDGSLRQEGSDSGGGRRPGGEVTPLGSLNGDDDGAADGSDEAMDDVLDAGVFAGFDSPMVAEAGGGSSSGGGAPKGGARAFGSLRDVAMRKEEGAMAASQPHHESNLDTAPVTTRASVSPDGFFPFGDESDLQ